MVQVLIVIAAIPFLLFGIGHGALTLRDLKSPRAFTPHDSALREAMQKASLRFHPDLNLWRAWLGFNLTHSLGLIVFGGAFLHMGIFAPGNFASSLLVQAAAVGVAAAYVAVSFKFFFSRPLIGSSIGLACFIAAAGLAQAGIN